MKSFKLALAALAASFTLSTAHAEIKQHTLHFQEGLRSMIVFMGVETPMSAYEMPDHPDLVRYAWIRNNDQGENEGTYDDYAYCDSTKPNQPVVQMDCYIKFDERSPYYKLFKNDPGMDK